jgi:cytochrome b pre-mRNA-processing protein 3
MIKMKWLFDRLLKPRYEVQMAHKLYDWAVSHARQPVFYSEYGLADTKSVRFEFLTLILCLMVLRLRQEKSEQSKDTAQALFDVYFAALDNMMREDGVGDLTVPKKMKKAAALIYTRLRKWDGLLSDSEAKDNSNERIITLLDTVYTKPEIIGEESVEFEPSAQSPSYGQAAKFNVHLSLIWKELIGSDLVKGVAPEIDIQAHKKA